MTFQDMHIDINWTFL